MRTFISTLRETLARSKNHEVSVSLSQELLPSTKESEITTSLRSLPDSGSQTTIVATDIVSSKIIN